jgi:hypothetical protein
VDFDCVLVGACLDFEPVEADFGIGVDFAVLEIGCVFAQAERKSDLRDASEYRAENAGSLSE